MNASLAELDERVLITRAAGGEAECYNILVHRYASAVRQFITSKLRSSNSDVDDLIQETFLKAWLGLPGFRFEAKFRSWLGQIALNEVFALYRRKRRRPACSELSTLEFLVSMIEPSDQIACRAEAARRIRAAISNLPPKYRETLTLCDLEELTERKTAEVTGSTIPAIKARRFRGRKMLSAALLDIAA